MAQGPHHDIRPEPQGSLPDRLRVAVNFRVLDRESAWTGGTVLPAVVHTAVASLSPEASPAGWAFAASVMLLPFPGVVSIVMWPPK